MIHFKAFRKSMTGIGVDASEASFSAIRECYDEPTRYYHNATHIAECLRQLDSYAHLAKRVSEIEIAIWFHDAIYDTRRNDNEQKSAEWAAEYLSSENVKSDCRQRIVEMILATKTHTTEDSDSALMVDIDLGILGADLDVFERYDRSIRQEYHWVPEAEYERARKDVLEGFLQRPTIYRTAAIRERYEGRARANLAQKIAALST